MKKYIIIALLCGFSTGLAAQTAIVPKFQVRVTPVDTTYFEANDSILNPFALMTGNDTVNLGISALVFSGGLPDSVRITVTDSNESVSWTGLFTDFQGSTAVNSQYILFNPSLVNTPYSPYFLCTAQFFKAGEEEITITRTFNNQ